jgi:sec-independent protein translocase protein TatA
MFGLGFGELVLIFIIFLIFVGPKKLPELAQGLGKSIKEFQKAAKGITEDTQETPNTAAKNNTDNEIKHS